MAESREIAVSDEVTYKQFEGRIEMHYAFARSSGKSWKDVNSIEANLLFEILRELRKLTSVIQHDDQPSYGPFLRTKEERR